MGELSESDLQKVLKGCTEHKREYQKMLYKEFYRYAMGICMRYSNDRDDAVEIMNDGFMKIFQFIGKFDRSRSFKPWLKRVMVNASIDHHRKNLKFKNHEDIDKAQKVGEAESVLAGISYEELLGVLKKLSPAYRMVFTLHAIEGYKHEEIGKMLGINEGTSKSNYAKARKRLQDLLSDFFEVDHV